MCNPSFSSMVLNQSVISLSHLGNAPEMTPFLFIPVAPSHPITLSMLCCTILYSLPLQPSLRMTAR